MVGTESVPLIVTSSRLLVNLDHWSYATFLGHGNEQNLWFLIERLCQLSPRNWPKKRSDFCGSIPEGATMVSGGRD